MQDLQVKKRDGTLEPWSLDKLVIAIGKAGISISEAQALATKIEDWARSVAKEGVVESTQIRDKVIELMKVDFSAESANYQTYKKE